MGLCKCHGTYGFTSQHFIHSSDLKTNSFHAVVVAITVVQYPRKPKGYVTPLYTLTFPHSLNEKSEHKQSNMYTTVFDYQTI
jgi:hypothetical protein